MLKYGYSLKQLIQITELLNARCFIFKNRYLFLQIRPLLFSLKRCPFQPPPPNTQRFPSQRSFLQKTNESFGMFVVRPFIIFREYPVNRSSFRPSSS